MCMQSSYVSWCVFLVFLHNLMLKVPAFSRHMQSSDTASISDHRDDQAVLKTGLVEKECLDLEKVRSFNTERRTEDSVFLHSGLISNTSNKCQLVSTEATSEYIKESPDTVMRFMVREMFVGSKDVCDVDQSQNMSNQEFQFKFQFNFNSSVDRSSDESRKSEDEVIDSVGNSVLEDCDCSYEVELNPMRRVSDSDVSNQVSDDHTESRVVEEEHEIALKKSVESDNECIELQPHRILLHAEEDIKHSEVKDQKELQENENLWDDNNDLDDDDDEDETDVLREHQDLVQQMKMELKHCRIKGLPTISEDCESPKVLEDLKHFKFERKFEYKDTIKEIKKFYKIYAERMCKLDILGCQTLHAISFLRLKDAEVFSLCKKKTGSTSSVFPRIRQLNIRKIYADSSHRSVSEMQRELELIYVGQLCLSWEILSWLHIKAQELLEYDSKGNHSYNRVSDEFQQFQVLLQRFMEDEQFQGERTMNYVNRRCMTCNLLQIPMIRDDILKDKKERMEETDAISLEFLIDIIRESMLVFRDFLYADKRATNAMLKSIHGNNKEDSNSRLLTDIIATLHKKDKRVKESIRSQSCIIKKLKKQQQEEEGRSRSSSSSSDNEVFKSQVDLRLISRVLSIPKLTTDQLLWCQMKLNDIGFVSRKVHYVEPSFLLFPC